MSMRRSTCAARFALLLGATAAIQGVRLHAQVVAPSVYTTAITVQGEPVGTEFADWAASGIPVVDMDPADNPGFVDLANLQVANDANYLYMHMTMHSAPASLGNLYLAFDMDQNSATGFNVFSSNLIGSEFAYQTDFPFQQATGVFNTGAQIITEFALIYPFWTGPPPTPPFGNEIEWRIPLSAKIGPAPGTPAFPGDSFDLMVYSTEGLGDVSQVIRYTLAEAPNQDGDFDGDQDVDGEDFLDWQRRFGGDLDGEDFALWVANFGATGGMSGVPEPASAVLALAVLATLARSRRRSCATQLFRSPPLGGEGAPSTVAGSDRAQVVLLAKR